MAIRSALWGGSAPREPPYQRRFKRTGDKHGDARPKGTMPKQKFRKEQEGKAAVLERVGVLHLSVLLSAVEVFRTTYAK